MKIIHSITELEQMISSASKSKTIGFVPTMGFLHHGHLSLAESARGENDLVVMSIFVNPLQFGPNEDFEQYPRDEEADRKKAEACGVDILFTPSVQEMYPEEMAVQMTITKGTNVLCGRSRPGHFDGVATVLTKLFHLIRPDKTYFGLKDAQQFAIVHTLIKQLNFQVQLIGLPTARENDGLAKSSRNVYLSGSERKEALYLYRSLTIGQQLIQQGERHADHIMKKVKHYLEEHINDGQIDYISLLSYPDLKKIDIINEQIILAIAIQYKQARLIDNIILTTDGEQVMRI